MSTILQFDYIENYFYEIEDKWYFLVKYVFENF